MSRRHIPSEWTLVTAASRHHGSNAREGALLMPPLPGSSFTALLSGLLPNRDHNRDLLHCMEQTSARTDGEPVCCIFAADPFINGRAIAPTLLARGYRRIVNWPTTAQYGPDFCNSLDSVHLGPRQELENLGRLAGQGLSVSIAVCSAEAAIAFLALDPELVFLAPSVELWTETGFCKDESLQRCALLARVIERRKPIVMMAPAGSVSIEDARKAGASALLLA